MSKPAIIVHIEELNAAVKIIGRDIADGGSKEYYKKTRIFVSGQETLPEVVIDEITNPLPPYGPEKGEDKAIDLAYARKNRLYANVTKNVAEKVVDALFSGVVLSDIIEDGHFGGTGVTPLVTGDRNARIRFSRTAGCSCGCSAGCVIDDTLRVGRIGPVDIFVQLTSAIGKNT